MNEQFLKGLKVNNGVVLECGAETIEVLGHGPIDVCLKGLWGVRQSKGPYQALEESILGQEVSRCDT